MPNWKKVIVSGSDATLNSLYAANSVTASIFSGSFTGSLAGTASWANNAISASYALTASFALNGGSGGGGGGAVTYHQTASAVTWSVNHSLNTYTPIVQVYDEDYNQLIPSSVSGSSVNAVQITFSTATAGYAVITTGGLTITGSNAFLFQSTPATTWSFYHGLNETYPVFTIFDSNDDVIVPLKIHADNANTASIYFSTARTGTAVAANCGLSGSTFESASYAAYAVSASFAQNTATSSYILNAVSASFASNAANATTASFITTAQTASFVTLAQTASYVLNAVSASYATSALSASFALRGNGTFSGSFSGSFSGNGADLTNIPASGVVGLNLSQITSGSVTASVDPAYGFKVNANTTISGSTQITGSLGVTGSVSITGSGTVLSANIDTILFTGSFAQSGSVTVVGGVTATSFTGSLLGTASFAVSASYALNATSASYITGSNVIGIVSNATSASYALNGGVTQLLAGPNITLAPTNGLGQVTISSTSGAGGFNTATGSYGSFYSTQTQTNVAGTARSMSLNVTDITNGVSISGSTNPYNTYIKTENAGVYNIQFSAQVDKSDAGADEIWIWLRKNGTNLTETATSIKLTGNADHQVAAWNFFANAAANDYFQLMWYSPDANVRLHAEPAFGLVPGIPSLIVTANRVDQFLSNTGSFSGSFNGNFTGSLAGTSSYATTASYAASASYALTSSYLNPITTGYVILTQVSQSLNYADDTAAAAGGVPLGGLYRNGNFIAIRIV